MILALAILFLLAGSAVPVAAQVATQLVSSEDETFHLREVGAMIMLEDEQVKVAMVMPKEARPKAYQDVDIQQGDIVLYLNGKRIKAVEDFEAKYNELAVGDTARIGLRRKDERFIVSFLKADPKALPTPMLRKVMAGPDGKITEESGGQVRQIKLSDPNAKEVRPVPGLGVLIGNVDGKVKIVNKLPIRMKELENLDLQESDVLQILNGNKIDGVGQFLEIYEKIATGEKVELKFVRNEKMLTASFSKPKDEGRMIIRRQPE
jgi:S1-C subfamily serine protease